MSTQPPDTIPGPAEPPPAPPPAVREPILEPLPPLEPFEPEPNRLPFSKWLPVVAGAVIGILMRLVFNSRPGEAYGAMMSSFVILTPMLVGAVTVYVAEQFQRRSWGYYIWMAAFANVLFVAGALAILIEGLICALVIVPVFVVLGIFGGLVMGAVCRLTMRPRQVLYCLAAVPLLLGGFEQELPLPERWRHAETVRIVDAPPAAVWHALVATGAIAADEVDSAWMYRLGVPLPEAGVAERTDEGIVRHVTMGSGIHFDQVASVWQPGQLVRWRYRFSDDSFPPRALDDHVKIGGHYFGLGDTDYVLRERGEKTELRVVMRYRVSTRFNWYAGPLADWLIGDFERTILAFYAHRAEAGQVRVAAAAQRP
ncbi:MAG: SRPBCC domain-containing protein [Pseudomonadota bacterium]|nr:SRPBCC domain-containing protein [Pseudomonadota bacterium]